MTGPKGYKKATKTTKKRIIMSVEGVEKEGKTTFGLSAPGPIALINMDVGLEGVVDKVLGEKEVWVSEFDYRDSTNTQEWTTQWNKCRAAYMDALKDDKVRTLVIDTATELWELVRLARLGKLSQVLPNQYGPVNAEFQDMVRKAYVHDKNVIFLHKMKGEYIQSKKTGESGATGRMVRSGFGNMPYLVQITVKVYRNGNGFGVQVLKCRQNPELDGVEYGEPMNTFPYVAMDAWEGSEQTDWE